MENRNQYNSPRDRIDDALLIRLLNEEEQMPEYNCRGERRNTNSSCECHRREDSPRQRRCENREHSCTPRYPAPSTVCDEKHMSMPPVREECGCGNTHTSCGCEDRKKNENCGRGGCMEGWHPAMVYMPDLDWKDLFDEEEALEHGTLFQALDLPFYPGKCRCSCRKGE